MKEQDNLKSARNKIVKKIFSLQEDDGCWNKIPSDHKDYPHYLHYVPTFKTTLWVLIQLADIGLDSRDHRVKKAMESIENHLFDQKSMIYNLRGNHFPYPCLNGNMLYLNAYFNERLNEKSLAVIEFFSQHQRFDDGEYLKEKSLYCNNKSCYGEHSCYWGIIKLLKGLSFIPQKQRNSAAKRLLKNCIDFVLLHQVGYSSRQPDRIMIRRMDRLTFPGMYKSDNLEILWLLKREKVKSEKMDKALDLLASKKNSMGTWNLERKIGNLITSIGPLGQPNPFLTQRASEIMDFYTSPIL